MKQFLETIAGILLILVLGVFSTFACWLGSDYEEGNDPDE